MRDVKLEIKQEAPKIVMALVGSLLYAGGLNLFIVPAGIYTGGLMGVAQLIRTILIEVFHVPVESFDIAGVIYYVMNIPLFFIAFTRIGRKFFAKTLLCVTAMTLFLSVIPVVSLLPDDVLAASLIGGIVSGVGIGLVLKNGGSSGGMDIVGILMIKSKSGASVGQANLLINVILYAVFLFMFDIRIVLYSLIYAVVHSAAIDRSHSQNINVEASIITKKNCPELEQEIFNRLGRGITRWQATGAYTEQNSQVLYVMISKYEEYALRSIIAEYDPEAFIVFNEGVSVFGHFIKKL